MMKKILIVFAVFLLSFHIFLETEKSGIPTDVSSVTELIPGGNAVGIKINIDGVIVVGETPVDSQDGRRIIPAKDAGIKEGDVIYTLNQQKIDSVDHLVEVVEQSNGEPISATILRKNRQMDINIVPCFSQTDQSYKLGLWVKENASGVGTVTYYNPKTGKFGALGHPITETETSEVLNVKDGKILKAKITGIKKGEKGSPGELKGVFSSNDVIGDIYENNGFGVFGTLTVPPSDKQPIPAATLEQTRTGKATILTNINSDTVEEYEVEIARIMPTARNTNKSLIIKITDPKLLAETGGIVQGMSGSPILQDGRLVGAITHVFVNDPTKGYGILVEKMLEN